MAQDTAAMIAELRQLLKSPERRQREQEQAYAELGPRFVERPISDIESSIPINRATKIAVTEGRLPAIAELSRLGLMGKGSLGELSLPNVRGMARGIASRAGRAQTAPDLEQAGNEAMLRLIAERGGTGQEAKQVARGAMRNYGRIEQGGLGAARADVNLLEKAQTKLGPVGELRLLGEIRKTDPSFTLEKLRHVRANIRQPDVRLDAPSIREGETVGTGLRGLADPSRVAELKEAVRGLTPQQQQNVLKIVKGEAVDPKIRQRIMQRLELREKPPISGGAAGPEDLSAEFPPSQFRVELSRQPRQMFGQEGFQVKHPGDPLLADILLNLERLHAETGGGNRLAPGAIPESGHHTLGAVRLSEDWDKLRSIFSTTGRFQGRN